MARYEKPRTRDGGAPRGRAERLPEPEARAPRKRANLREMIEAARRRGPVDMPFLVLVLLLLLIGVVMVLSSSFARSYFLREDNDAMHFFRNQIIFSGVGIAAMLFVSIMPVELFRRFSVLLLTVTIVMLGLVLIPGIGREINGARRWLGFGEASTFQPSEFAKIAVIVVGATVGCRYQSTIKSFRYGTLPFLALVGGIAFMVVLERHFSGTIIIGLLGIAMMFLSGCNLGHIAGIGAVGAGGLAVMILTRAYSSDRITGWLNAEGTSQGAGYQVLQSLYAIGSGGLLGVGLGQSRQKYLYLPESYNDYIFSIICEELGFIGAILIIALFGLLIWRGYVLAMNAKNRFGSLLVGGVTSMIALQTMINIAVVTRSMPSTGVALPFFSYGGTALILQLAEMGIVLSVSRDIPMRKPKKKKERADA